MKFLLIGINAKYIHSNLAIYTLKEYAEEQMKKLSLNHPEITIKEYTINNLLDNILQDIYKERPNAIFFSCYIWNIEYINKLIPELAKLYPDVPIWCGGPEVSHCAEKFLKLHDGKVKGVFLGEGEISFSKTVEHYCEKTSELSNIPGICYVSDQKIFTTPLAEPIDMNNIPFIYKSLNSFENRIIYYESSRGCPFSCSYCLSSIDKRIRFRDLEQVKEELQFFLDNNVPQVKFIDRTFNCNPDRATAIWKYIHEKDNMITNFHFEIAADLLTHEQLELLKDLRPGQIQFEIGVQSTNLETLSSINRVCSLDKIKENVHAINSFENIHQHLDLIAGLPMEDYESFKNSFNNVFNMKPEQLQLGFLKVLSGSPIQKQTSMYGIEYKSYAPYEVLYTNYISYDEILKLKQVEEVVEIYHNSHQFDGCISYLLSVFDTPFDLFYSLGNFYYDNYDTNAKHSRLSRYNTLLEFASSLETVDIFMFKQLLTLDIYLREKIKKRPDFSINLTEYKDDILRLRKKYNLSNSEHIDVFIKDNKPVFVHFNYEKINPLTQSAETKELI